MDQKSDFKLSLKNLVVDEERALDTYRKILNNRYNMSSNNFSANESSESSGNIQEIGMEEREEDERYDDDDFEL